MNDITQAIEKVEARLKWRQLGPIHYIDIIVRRNGKDERYEGDWLKDLPRLVREVARVAQERVAERSLGIPHHELRDWLAALPEDD